MKISKVITTLSPSVAAFATVTEEEVLALKGVGPATVKKLKENGVSFKA